MRLRGLGWRNGQGRISVERLEGCKHQRGLRDKDNLLCVQTYDLLNILHLPLKPRESRVLQGIGARQASQSNITSSKSARASQGASMPVPRSAATDARDGVYKNNQYLEMTGKKKILTSSQEYRQTHPSHEKRSNY